MVIYNRSFLLLILSFSSLYAEDKPLPESMLKIMHQPKYQHSSWGVYAKDAETGAELYDLNSDIMFLPASTTKIFSVEALINAYGNDYRFKTAIYGVGDIENGKLNGNLVLVGQGDLTFSGRQRDADTIEFTKLDHIIANMVPGTIITKEDPLNGIKNLAHQVKEKGILEINGNCLIDDRLFEIVTQRDMILSPIMINENMLDFVINPTEDTKTANLVVRPLVRGYTVKNELVTVSQDKKLEINITSDDLGQHIVIKGSVPVGQKDQVRTFSIKDPNHFARSALLEALENEGIKVNKPQKPSALPEKMDYQLESQLAVWTSPPLSEYAKLILKVSHNLGADLIPLLLSVKDGKTTYDEGMLLLGKFVTEKVKVSKNSFVFVDAAGGDANRLTPKAEVTLLEYVRNQPKDQFQKFYDALPILGVDGSLEDFGTKLQAKGKARAKPGTGVSFNASIGEFFLTTQAFAGFVEGKNGHLIEFMIVVNNAEMPIIDDVMPIFQDLSEMTGIIYDLSD